MAVVPPSGDFPLQSFCSNLSGRITATPTAYGLVASDATQMASLLTDYSARLAAATTTATRNKITVAAKNTSKSALTDWTRILLKKVSAFPNLSAAQREELGMNPKDTTKTPVPPPATKPLVTVDPAGRVRLADEATPTRRARPVGTIGALLFTHIDGAAPDSPDSCRLDALATRTTHALSIPPGSNGKTLYVLAQWVNETGRRGPVSTVAVTTIAA